MAEYGFTPKEATEILKSRITETTYICMSRTTPTKAGGNFDEPDASTGYRRPQIGVRNVSTPSQISNQNYIFMFEALADCGSFTHLGLSRYEDIGGAVFLVAPLAAPITVPSGYVPLIRPDKLVIQLDPE